MPMQTSSSSANQDRIRPAAASSSTNWRVDVDEVGVRFEAVVSNRRQERQSLTHDLVDIARLRHPHHDIHPPMLPRSAPARRTNISEARCIEPERIGYRRVMTAQLQDRRIAFLTANEGVEQVELTEPWDAVKQAGGTPVLVAPEAGKVQAFNHLDKADTFEASIAAADADAGDFDGLVLPGGVANPDQLRMNDDAVRFVKDFFEAGKPVAVICHGPWTLVEAGVLDGRTITSWPSVRTDIENAGGTWRDEEVVVCDNGPNTLVSSRKPDDLPGSPTVSSTSSPAEVRQLVNRRGGHRR